MDKNLAFAIIDGLLAFMNYYFYLDNNDKWNLGIAVVLLVVASANLGAYLA